MSQTQILIGSTSTSHLLKNLGLAIDEAKLVRVIGQLSSQVQSIESASGRSQRTLYLQKEIVNLENQLADVRSREQWG